MKTLLAVLAALLAFPFGPAADAADKVVRVGAPLPLTGPLSPEGLKQKRGYDLWADAANAAGGIRVGADRYKVELVYNDYQSNTPRAVQLAEKLITDDKVNFLFSPFGSGATKAASGVSEKYGIPTIAATASSEEVYNQGYKFLFGTFTPNPTLTEPLSSIVKAKVPAVKKVAILARNDLFPLAIAQEMDKSAKKRGFEVVFFEKYAIGTMDHASALTQIKAAQPQWIFATGYINDLVLIRKQMGDLGIAVPVVTMIAGPAYKEFVEATGKLAENVSSAAWWHPAVRYRGQDVFGTTESYNRAFEARHKAVPDYAEASASAAGAILQVAIERAGSVDPKKVRDALAGLDAMTFFGPVKFGPTGQIVSLQPPVFQIQDGRPVVIYPEAIKQAELRIGVK
ncbi:MAG: ABC transporter substrate-binding protein [Betaproteobacteria bacterium RIFCSPLOWO2_12_FULL_66_14]|nr:MAG: ABC transporter substrate-binding protein [Betaproteobacteria bacterium RIFCSPLOWO2_12_FULL_66_14]